MEEVKFCPVCGSDKQKLFLTCEDFTVSHEKFSIQQCADCNFKFTSPRPQRDELGRYYKSEEYVSHSDTKKGIINRLYHMVREYTILKKLRLVLRYSKPGNILDYGCGTGAFLEVCKKAKWNVFGIEPDSDARRIAADRIGFNPSVDIEAFRQTNAGTKLKVITLWHVLEHVPDLNGWFSFVDEFLDSDGTLVVAVPNCSSYDAQKFQEYWAAYDVPRHLWHFTPADIETLFRKHGYALKETLPMVFDAFYVTMLSQKYKFGKTNLFTSFWTGLKSNFKANKTGKTFSSQIYVLKRR
jgi:2-polyprenyl-3-methyl-5-hydroxy-6-metoxy-1,4-benzoquinol methylase